MSHSFSRRTFCGLALSTVFAARAQVADLNDAINKAGRQRMLSQRMSKAYLSLGQGIEVPSARRVLDQSMALFDRQLAELKAFAPAGATRDTYQQLEAEWSQFKSLLVGASPNQATAKRLLEQDAKLLALAHRGTGQLEQQSGKPLGKLVNVAGRQRMLSQRMAKFYLAASWNVEPQASAQEIAKARDEFVAALELLRNAPEATTDIRQELLLADGQWLFLNNALNARASSPRAASDVFVSSENLLQVMDRVTGLYARAVH